MALPAGGTVGEWIRPRLDEVHALARLEVVLDLELADELPSDDAGVKVVRRALRSVLYGDLPEAAD